MPRVYWVCAVVDDDLKKKFEFVEREFAKAMSHHIGEKIDKNAVQATVAAFLEKLSERSEVIVSDVEVVGDTLKYSFANPIRPVFKGPYAHWLEDGVVHIVGRIGAFDVKACDFKRIRPGDYGHPSMMVTCLTCVTLSITA